jgi:hypothetical protein
MSDGNNQIAAVWDIVIFLKWSMASEIHESVINPKSRLAYPICLMDRMLLEFVVGASVLACAFLIDCPTCDLQTRIKRLWCHPLILLMTMMMMMMMMMVVAVWADRSFCYGETNYRNNGCCSTGSPPGQSIKGQDILDSPEVIRSPPITRGLPLNARSLADWTWPKVSTVKRRKQETHWAPNAAHFNVTFGDIFFFFGRFLYDKWCCCIDFRGWVSLLVYLLI